MKTFGRAIWFIEGIFITIWRMIVNPRFRDDIIRSLNDISEYHYD